MSMQPMTDRQLGETSGRQNTTGARLLLLGGLLFVIGLVLMLVGEETVDYVGVVFATLATPPTVAGLALMLSGLVGHRASQQKPFA